MALESLFRRVFGDQVTECGGRVVKFLGDGGFAAFESAEAAAESARRLTREFDRATDAEGVEAILRVGIHLGDVVEGPDGDLLGDGVNTAARLQSAAEPGEILVSDAVWRQLRHRRGYAVQFVGERQLKGMATPERTYVLGGLESDGVTDASSGARDPVVWLRDRSRMVFHRVRKAYPVLATLLVLVLAGVLARETLREDDPPPLRYGSLLLPEGTQWPGDLVQPFDVSPDGGRLAYVVEREGSRELYTRLVSEPTGTPVVGTGPSIGDLAFSPDGAWIAFHVPDARQIRKVPARGGPVETVTTLGPDEANFRGIAWVSDEALVFSWGERLMRVPADGGTLRVLTAVSPEEGIRHERPSPLPQGDGVVFTIAEKAYPSRHRIALHRFGEDPVILTEGHSPRIVDRILLFVRGGRGSSGGVWGAPLNGDMTEVTGQPVRVHQDVRSHTFGLRYAFFSVASDGTLVYPPPAGLNALGLAWVDRNGEVETLLSMGSDQLPSGMDWIAAPRISPEGDRIAFRASGAAVRQFRLFVYDLQRSVVSPIPVDANADWPVWTLDGTRLVFNRFTAEEQNLYVARANGGGEPQPFQPPNRHQQHALDFTPDGRGLLVQHREYNHAPDSDILLLESGGDGETEVVLEGPGFEHQGALSPDGRRLAYVSDVSGRREIYITDFPRADTRMKISSEGGFSPVWNPRGDELFYRRSQDGAMVVVEVSTAAPLRAGVPRLLFEGRFSTCCVWGRTFDVGSGGERFLMIPVTEEAPATPRLEVVQGWLGMIERRLGD